MIMKIKKRIKQKQTNKQKKKTQTSNSNISNNKQKIGKQLVVINNIFKSHLFNFAFMQPDMTVS